jgi:hydroxymethylpyrimidine/phosphomethylpyrimidine kinase
VPALARLLSIAGSDPSGGAGAQADIKTFSAFGCYGMAVITALTAQNTQGVTRVSPVTPDMVAAQIDAIFVDIAVDAVKIGMLAGPDITIAVARALRRGGARNIVLDPVLAPTSGEAFGEDDAPAAIIEHLAPLAALITPNLAEAAALTGTPQAQGVEDMEAQARALVQAGAEAALVKGGHLDGAPIDVLFTRGALKIFSGVRVDTRQTHGTGCALSSAIAAGLGQGLALEDSIARAKTWLEHALIAGEEFRLGGGSGPPDHLWEFRVRKRRSLFDL